MIGFECEKLRPFRLCVSRSWKGGPIFRTFLAVNTKLLLGFLLGLIEIDLIVGFVIALLGGIIGGASNLVQSSGNLTTFYKTKVEEIFFNKTKSSSELKAFAHKVRVHLWKCRRAPDWSLNFVQRMQLQGETPRRGFKFEYILAMTRLFLFLVVEYESC